MWAVHSSGTDDAASSGGEPMLRRAAAQSPFRLADHSQLREVARSTTAVNDVMSLTDRPASRIGNPLVKHMPLRIIYTPKIESGRSRPARHAQLGPHSGRRIRLRESNTTSDGFSLLSHENTS
jgi:hypothetical protein